MGRIALGVLCFTLAISMVVWEVLQQIGRYGLNFVLDGVKYVITTSVGVGVFVLLVAVGYSLLFERGNKRRWWEK